MVRVGFGVLELEGSVGLNLYCTRVAFPILLRSGIPGLFRDFVALECSASIGRGILVEGAGAGGLCCWRSRRGPVDRGCRGGRGQI